MQISSSEDYRPLARVGQMPVYMVTVIVAAAALGMLLTAFGPESLRNGLAFRSSHALPQFMIWQFATYWLVNPPNIWLLLSMVLLYLFGRDVEQFIGWRRFLQLIVLLVLVPPFLLTLWNVVEPAGMYGVRFLSFGMIIAFATLHPRVEVFFTIQARWVAWFVVGMMILYALANESWPMLLQVVASAGVGHFYMRSLGFQGGMPWLESLFQEQPVGSPSPESRKRSPRKPKAEPDLHESIDPLLDKISKEGLSSLTPKERELLNRARDSLIEREKKKS